MISSLTTKLQYNITELRGHDGFSLVVQRVGVGGAAGFKV